MSAVCEHADQVIELVGSGGVWSLALQAGDSAEQRAAIIDHHEQVVAELRRRGHPARATVVRDEPDREYLAIGLIPDDA